MSEMIEVTVRYDSTNTDLVGVKTVKALIDVTSIRSVTDKSTSKACVVIAVANGAAISEEGDATAEEHRILHVDDSYDSIRQVLSIRGIHPARLFEPVDA